ncbi:DUF3108 domain-containing protein [Thermodesulfobacteriota bacterium]
MTIEPFNDKKVPPKRKRFLASALLHFWFILFALTASAATIPAADSEYLRQAYSREETLVYEISWMGVTAGTLSIHLLPDQNEQQRFAIQVTAKSAGLLAVFYPVEDHFETIVTGTARLPIRYSIDQHEGHRHNKKLTTYDQEQGLIARTRNQEATETHKVSGPTYNEFSSFMIMRALPLVVGSELMVPTFADKKRHEVKVQVEKKEQVSSIFGKIESIRVRPQLNFKGLYKKTGDPTIWISDDMARIPLQIKAKIVIGSLTAKLVAYQGWKQVPKPKPARVNNDEESLL